MLSATLRQLERDGLVERHVYARVPARVEYELSPVGANLLDALIPLAGWGLEHQVAVTNAREHFDRLQRWRSEGEEIKARSQADSSRIV
jgi:DNA-binding HxlR family transcriptional regulator